MPVTINDVEIMTDDGKLTEGFNPSMLGDAYKDSRLFGKARDIVSIMKVAHDSKSSLSDATAKLKNAIQKPPDDADETQKTEFRTLLKKELGSPDSIEAYVVKKIKGAEWDPEAQKVFKELCLEEGVPADSFARITEKMDTCRAAAENQRYSTESETFKTGHPGDKMVSGLRTALKAIIQFATPEQKELTDNIRAGKILDNPDLDAIRELGLMPSILANWEIIGNAMKSDIAITNEGVPADSNKSGPKEGTTEALIADRYNHPSSVKARKDRGLNY